MSSSSVASMHVAPVLRSEGGPWSIALTVAVLTLAMQAIAVASGLLLLAVFNLMDVRHPSVTADFTIEVALCALFVMALAVPGRLTQSWAERRSVDAGNRRASATRKVVFFALVVWFVPTNETNEHNVAGQPRSEVARNVSPLAMVVGSGILFAVAWW